MTTKLTRDNIDNLKNLSVAWQSVITADGSTNTNVESGKGYFIDTTSATHTVVLPTNASIGDIISIKDYAGTFGSNALTINRNGHNIQGVAFNNEINTNRASISLFYVDSTKGWIYSKESNVADLQTVQYVTATGGTVATSGDYKIHTFTGDGCFVVSCGGNPVGNDKVDYLVVAGGGGSGGGGAGYNNTSGGGGAGGYREGKQACGSPHSASPLAASTGLTVSTTTYPVTVGGGGAGGAVNSNANGTNGSNSIFSTITSAGGGRGGAGISYAAGSGGSGGGAGEGFPNPIAGGAGNTPPTSPPQGQPGGTYGPPNGGAGTGGGGALQAGQVAPGGSGSGGNGGNGAGTGINPSPTIGAPGPNGALRYFSGGGGGGPYGTPGAVPGQGGYGGGGESGDWPANPPSAPTEGVANSGGGGGASYSFTGPNQPASGGSGAVIIRYKYK